MNDLLIIFTKYPEPGAVKTRLIDDLGEEGAAKLSRKMTEDTIAVAREACSHSGATLEVRYTGGSAEQMHAWLGESLTMKAQGAGDLGARMARAFRQALENGARRVIIIGIDCPDLDYEIINKAFSMLGVHDLVLGPAHDGGYYLIGLARHMPQLFEQIAWGTERVFATTKDIAEKAGCSLYLLPWLHDVDRPEDLTRPAVSVIIPTLNEEDNLAKAIDSAAAGRRTEVIVVDGGSTDATASIARTRGVRVIESARGRAGQMNAGAKEARGDCLVFLHADSRLPRGFEVGVVETLKKKHVACGAFSLKFDGASPVLRFLEFTTRFRSRTLKLPYGDQALFIKASTFHDLGGFPNLPLMDDVVFVRHARKWGKVVTLSREVTTSSRRYEKKGPVRTTLLNQMIILGYFLGISPKRLAAWYRDKR